MSQSYPLERRKRSMQLKSIAVWKGDLESGALDPALQRLYGADSFGAPKLRQRFLEALEGFQASFPERTLVGLFSAPGRTEIGGNHTDHQLGWVLGAAVSLDVIGVVSPRPDNVIRVQSQGYPLEEVDLAHLEPVEGEKETSQALIRGIAARFHQFGYRIGGFDAYTTSAVMKGGGLSSSAAFEVLIGTVLNHLYNGGLVDPQRIAQVGQYAENVYFGKQCGLMDQMVSAVGGFVSINFGGEQPGIRQIPFDFSRVHHHLCVTEVGSSHENLSEEYSAIPAEMKAVAACFGQDALSRVLEEDFYLALPQLHGRVSDRAILRAAHFFGETRRAKQQAQALEQGDFPGFLALVRQSGLSSFRWLQNIFAPEDPTHQPVALALLASERILGEKGACRVHGGGFAGTIQAFVPDELLCAYVKAMEALFGEGSCHQLAIRPWGGAALRTPEAYAE